jgi:molecular chaperone GrpE
MSREDAGLVGPDGSPVSSADGRAAEAEKKAAEAQEQMLRLRAEFENVKKRFEREKIDAIKYANERLLAEVLPIVDNLDRATASLAEGHDPEKVNQGLRLAQNELHQVLETHGVEVVKALGEKFDPRLHEAVGVAERDDVEEGTVVDEIQRGYLLNGRLIRPSRVRIAQAKN